MESILKSDIFFFVTTICVFVVTALVVMILVEVLRMTKNIRHITECFKGEAHNLATDFATFRVILQDNQFGFKPIFDGIKKTVSSFSKGKGKPRKPKQKKPEMEPDKESEFI